MITGTAGLIRAVSRPAVLATVAELARPETEAGLGALEESRWAGPVLAVELCLVLTVWRTVTVVVTPLVLRHTVPDLTLAPGQGDPGWVFARVDPALSSGLATLEVDTVRGHQADLVISQWTVSLPVTDLSVQDTPGPSSGPGTAPSQAPALATGLTGRPGLV